MNDSDETSGLVDSDEENSKKLVLTDRSGDIFLIGLNRPEKRNCINEETATQLLQAVAEFEKDPSAKVGVLYGKGMIMSIQKTAKPAEGDAGSGV